jgi:hypothetical protein
VKVARFMIGLALMPACAAFSAVVADMLRLSGGGESWWRDPPTAMLGGFLAWVAAFYLLPSPIRAYVLAHELTHALWGALMGARIESMRISKESGSVTLSKTNLLITLAPYFFPLYAVIVIAAYYAVSFFRDVRPFTAWWLALVGFAWGFHFTFTVSTLLQRQPDILRYGRVFSLAVIYLVNVASLCAWITAVTEVGARDLGGAAWKRTRQSYMWVTEAGRRGAAAIKAGGIFQKKQ